MTLEVCTIQDGNQFFGAGSIVFLDDFDDVHGSYPICFSCFFGGILSFSISKKNEG